MGSGASRWLPVIGAVGVGAYAYWDTSRVAKTAIDLFGRQVKALPAVYPVNAYPVRVRDGVVEIDVGIKTRELEIG